MFIGDLVNKGPDTVGVLEWVRANGAKAILGNHEWKLLSCLDAPENQRTPKQLAFLAQFAGGLTEYGAWIATWPLWLEWGDLLAVHAGVQPGESQLQEMARRVLLTIRTWDGVGENLDRIGDPAWYDVADWPMPVVFGHWAARGLVDRPGYKGLDTGCVYGGRLTAWSPEENRFWQVPAHREWVPFGGPMGGVVTGAI